MENKGAARREVGTSIILHGVAGLLFDLYRKLVYMFAGVQVRWYLFYGGSNVLIE